MFTGPNIVTEGLVLALDAGNKKSYPGSGTTWTDLSGQGNNGTLQNGPTFDSGNNGSIVFDGVNDYISIESISLNSANITAISWVYLNSFYESQNSTIGIHIDGGTNGGFRVYAKSSLTGVWMRYSNGNATSISSNNTLPLNKWFQITFISDGQTGKIYLNENVFLSGTFSNTPVNVNGSAWISRFSGGGYYLVGNTSTSLLYNRALTPQEVQQNYNATKSRFGLT